MPGGPPITREELEQAMRSLGMVEGGERAPEMREAPSFLEEGDVDLSPESVRASLASAGAPAFKRTPNRIGQVTQQMHEEAELRRATGQEHPEFPPEPDLDTLPPGTQPNLFGQAIGQMGRDASQAVGLEAGPRREYETPDFPISPIQKFAFMNFGVQPQKLQQPPEGLLPDIELDPEMKELFRDADDLVKRKEFLTGISPVLKGNFGTHAEFLRQYNKSLSPDLVQSYPEIRRLEQSDNPDERRLAALMRSKLNWATAINAKDNLFEFSQIPGFMARLPYDLSWMLKEDGVMMLKRMIGWETLEDRRESMILNVPKGVAGEEFDTEDQVRIKRPEWMKLPLEDRQRLLALGAHPAGPEDVYSKYWQLWRAMRSDYGFVEEGEIPEGATFSNLQLFGSEVGWSSDQFAARAREYPLYRALDATLIAAVPSLLLRGTATTARFMGNLSARAGRATRVRPEPRFNRELRRIEGVGTGPIERAFETLERGLVKTSLKTDAASDYMKVTKLAGRGFGVVRKGLEHTEIGRDMYRAMDSWYLAKKLVNTSKDLHFAQRRKAEVQIYDALRHLTDDEMQLMVPILEGRAQPIKDLLSPQMRDALDTTRGLIMRRQDELLDAGFLTAQNIEARRWAPLVVSRTGKLIPYRNWTPLDLARENTRLIKYNQRMRAMGYEKEMHPLYMGVKEWEGELKAVQSMVDDVTRDYHHLPQFTELDPVYFPRFTGHDANEVRRWFMLGTGVRRPGKPPIVRHFSGLELLRNVEVKDLQAQLYQMSAQSLRIVNADKLIRELVNSPFTEELPLSAISGRPIQSALKDGYSTYAPDGFLKFYRNDSDLSREVADRLGMMGGDIEQAIAGGLQHVFGAPEMRAGMIGVKRAEKVYQIPNSMKAVIDQQFSAPHPMMKLIMDKPLDAWRTSVLAFSPRWYVNNIVGGLVLGTTAGLNPATLVADIGRAGKAAAVRSRNAATGRQARRADLPPPSGLTAQEVRVLPERLESETMVAAEGYRAHMGGAAETKLGQIHEAISNSDVMLLGRGSRSRQAIEKARDLGFELNQLVDNHFRSRIYLKVGRKEARNQLMKDTGRAVLDDRQVLAKMERFLDEPATVDALLKKVDDVHINFNNMHPFERRWIRRAIPFWNWYREIARVTLKMPFESPMRAQIIQKLGALGQMSDDMEVRRHLGFPKEHLDKFLQGEIFAGLNNDGTATFMSPRGLNVFYGVAMPETFLALHPLIQFGLSEQYAGRNFGRWGTYVPFRNAMETQAYEQDSITGEVVTRSGPAAGIFHRLGRIFPQLKVMEDVAQLGTEGQITQRFSDRSPLPNIMRQLTGGKTKQTARFNFVDDEYQPRFYRDPKQMVGAQLGLHIMRVRLAEILEQNAKARNSGTAVISKQAFIMDDEARELMQKIVEAGGKEYEGLATGRPPRPVSPTRRFR